MYRTNTLNFALKYNYFAKFIDKYVFIDFLFVTALPINLSLLFLLQLYKYTFA